MAITSTLTTSFKKELLTATHNFATNGNAFKLALFTSSATMGATTTAYSTSQEVSGTNYTAGGAALTKVAPTSGGTTGFTDFADLTFGTATVTARGCLIYNDTNSDKSVATIDFGGDKTSTAGDFTIVFPAAAASTATVTARGCLIYNDTNSDKSVATIDFGGDKTSTAGDFTIVFPAAAASTAIIRIA